MVSSVTSISQVSGRYFLIDIDMRAFQVQIVHFDEIKKPTEGTCNLQTRTPQVVADLQLSQTASEYLI